MLDFSTPFAWIWLASLILITSLIFKRQVLLFWLLVCPPIIALKMQVPLLVIAAGIGGVMTGLIFHALMPFFEKPPSEDMAQLELRLPLWAATAITTVSNLLLAGLVSANFNPDAWFKPLGIPERGFSMVYLVVGFISALVIFMLFIRSNRPNS